MYCLNYKVFATQLGQAKVSNFGKFKPDVRVKHLCRLNMIPSYPFERQECRYYAEQKELRSRVSNDIDFLITPTPYLESGSIIDVFTKKELSASELSQLYDALARYIPRCYGHWILDEVELSFIMGVPLQELFSHILTDFIGNKLALRFSAGSSPLDHHVDLVTAKNKRKWIRMFSMNAKDGEFGPSRTWELAALTRLLSRQNEDQILVATSNINLYNPDGSREVEWDGAFLTLRDNDTTLCIVEAKRGETRKSKQCRNSLMNSIYKSGILATDRQLKTTCCNGYAYTCLPLSDVMKWRLIRHS